MISTITIAHTARTKGVDMFLPTGILVDMFPHTDGILDVFPHTADIHSGVSGHCEIVCLLGKRKPDATAKLSVDMDDYYRIINGKDEE